MDRFKQRIKFYLIGFLIGLLIMFMIFGNRGCSWLPGNRVKNMIAEKEIIIGDSMNEVMACSGIRNTEIYAMLNEAGDVNFGESQTDVYPKKYLIEGDLNNQSIGIRYALYDTLAEVIGIHVKGKEHCSSMLSNEIKTTVPLPDADVRAIIESHEIRIMSKAQCQIDCMKLNEQAVLDFHKSSVFVVELSRPRKFPNPEYVLKGKLGNQELFVRYVIGENRSRIADIFPNECSCLE